MKKIGIIRGANLNKWEMQIYEPLVNHGFELIGVCSKDNRYDIKDIKFKIRKLKRFAQINKIPILDKIIQLFLPLNDWMFGLENKVKDIELLLTLDQHYPFTYQCIKIGKPTICTVWENIAFNNNRSLYKYWKKQSYKKAAHFVAVTKKARDALIQEGVSAKKISVVPAGIDINIFKPAAKDNELMRKYGLEKDNINILFAGRLTEEKGINELLEVFEKLSRKYPSLRLLIVGSGKKLNSMNNKIKYLDFLDYKEMPRIYNLADIFCVPSKPCFNKLRFLTGRKYIWEEQFGYVFVEAMACGKAVISTRSGSIPEVVEDGKTGILIEPGNKKQLAKALETLINDSKRRKDYGINGRKLSQKRFDAVKISKRLAVLYKKVLR